MKRLLFAAITLSLSLTTVVALAGGPVTRVGTNYSGIRNPDGCQIGPDGLRSASIREFETAAAPFDAILMPTVPCTAPTIAEATASDDAYFRWNGRILRNVGLINFLDGCAASVPCHVPGSAPVGLSVCGVGMSDRHTLAVARAVEVALAER